MKFSYLINRTPRENLCHVITDESPKNFQFKKMLYAEKKAIILRKNAENLLLQQPVDRILFFDTIV